MHYPFCYRGISWTIGTNLPGASEVSLSFPLIPTSIPTAKTIIIGTRCVKIGSLLIVRCPVCHIQEGGEGRNGKENYEDYKNYILYNFPYSSIFGFPARGPLSSCLELCSHNQPINLCEGMIDVRTRACRDIHSRSAWEP